MTLCCQRSSLVGFFIALTVTVATSDSASGALITLGEQDFSDGDFIANSLAFDALSAGEPAPFDMFRGNDRVGVTFSSSWTFNYAPQSVFSAALTLGIFDHDSAARGEQVTLFTVDGLDLTAELSALFEGRGGTQLEYNVYTLSLPTLVLARLGDGFATMALTIEGPSLGGGPGTSDLEFFFGNNGAGLDFASLRLGAVPEPSALSLMGFVSLLLVTTRRKKVVDVGRAPPA